MIWHLRFNYAPDYTPFWHLSGRMPEITRLWKVVTIQADNEEHSKEIADRYMSEHSFARMEYLIPITLPTHRTSEISD